MRFSYPLVPTFVLSLTCLTPATSAQSNVFQRYHVGGCSSCGFQPSDTLAQVCKDHNILDVNEVIQHILRSHEVDQRIGKSPRQCSQPERGCDLFVRG